MIQLSWPSQRRRGLLALALATLAVCLAIGVPFVKAQGYVTYQGDYRTMLVSRADGNEGAAASGDSITPSLSEDARFIGFVSAARNLGPTGGHQQVFVRALRDRCRFQCVCCQSFTAPRTETILISRVDGRRGRPGDGDSTSPALDGGGNKIAFASDATNLGGRPGVSSVYLRNLFAGSTTLISRASGEHGAKANRDSVSPSIDDSAHHIVFASGASNLPGAVPGVTQIYERDVKTNHTTLVSQANDGSPGNGSSSAPQISADGRAVVFQSAATNLGAPTGSGTQIYERRLDSGQTILVSADAAGKAADADSITPSVDGDGQKVAFASRATNLDPTANRVQNIFVKDLQSGEVILNSRTLGNQHAHVDDGAPANGDSFDPSFERVGRFVCFGSVATNLGNNYDGFGVDTSVQNVYVHDMQNHGTFLISRATGRYGPGGNGDSSHVDCSAGASLAAFQSTATNLSGVPVGGSSIYRRTIFGGR